MEITTKLLTKIVADAFEQCGYDRKLGAVSVSDRMDLCQFQCNGALSGAKIYKKAPAIIAGDVVNLLKDNNKFSKVEVANPGFINITLSDEFLLELANNLWQDKNVGVPQADSQETIVLDYGGPNVAKPLHIGHLRSAIIGEALKRLVRATGRKVIGDVHLGDWGTQMGLVISELAERNPDWRCFAEDFDPKNDDVPTLTADLLSEVYPFASKKSKENEEFKDKARQATAELQNGRPGYIALWKEIVRVSVEDLKKSYSRLNVDFDLWYGESDADKYVDELVSVLSRDNLLHESEGAMVVDVAEESDKEPMPPVIIKKSDNSSIYATTDLATILQRQKDFAPQKIWYVVDKRQSLHFTQVFRCAKKAKIVPETTELEHLGFGTVNGSDGKPYKTRDGGVMQLSTFLDTARDAAYERIANVEFADDEQRRETAEKLGIAAVKFGDLINHRAKDYIFDMDKFLSSEGKTGVYLLYMITRINSVFRKANICEGENFKLSGIYTDVERELLLTLILSSEAFEYAFSEKAPNIICENAYHIANVFSKFYQENHIMNEQDADKKQTWISLCMLAKKDLIKHLDILAIDTVEVM